MGLMLAALLVAIAVGLAAIVVLAVRVDSLRHELDRLKRRVDNEQAVRRG